MAAARRARPVAAAPILFVPISFIIFFRAHTFGWEAACCASRPKRFAPARGKAIAGGRRCSAPPIISQCDGAAPALLMILWRTEATGGKDARLVQLDLQMGIFSRALCATAGNGSILPVSPCWSCCPCSRCSIGGWCCRATSPFSGLVLTAGFILLLRVIFGSAYADMRLVPYIHGHLQSSPSASRRRRSIRWPGSWPLPGSPSSASAPSLSQPRHRRQHPGTAVERARRSADGRARGHASVGAVPRLGDAQPVTICRRW